MTITTALRPQFATATLLINPEQRIVTYVKDNTRPFVSFGRELPVKLRDNNFCALAGHNRRIG